MVVRDDDGERITFLTNNTSLAPATVGELNRLRWQVLQDGKIAEHWDVIETIAPVPNGRMPTASSDPFV